MLSKSLCSNFESSVRLASLRITPGQLQHTGGRAASLQVEPTLPAEAASEVLLHSDSSRNAYWTSRRWRLSLFHSAAASSQETNISTGMRPFRRLRLIQWDASALYRFLGLRIQYRSNIPGFCWHRIYTVLCRFDISMAMSNFRWQWSLEQARAIV